MGESVPQVEIPVVSTSDKLVLIGMSRQTPQLLNMTLQVMQKLRTVFFLNWTEIFMFENSFFFSVWSSVTFWQKENHLNNGTKLQVNGAL